MTTRREMILSTLAAAVVSTRGADGEKAPKKVVAMMRGMLGECNVRVEHVAKRASSEEPAK